MILFQVSKLPQRRLQALSTLFEFHLTS